MRSPFDLAPRNPSLTADHWVSLTWAERHAHESTTGAAGMLRPSPGLGRLDTDPECTTPDEPLAARGRDRAARRRALRDQRLRPTDAAAAQTGYGPWVGGGLVRVELRGQGIGTRLLDAMEGEARRLGFATIYCSTTRAQRLLEDCGWESIGTITHEGAPLSVNRKAI
jgi:GNAT superfamily N-acetyltransferase